jgi:hypothetical protein
VPAPRSRRRVTGPTTRSAAYSAGLNDRHLHAVGVERLSRDTYVPSAVAADLQHRVAAVLLTAPAGAVVSHRTAAAFWGLQVPLQDPGAAPVDLVLPASSRAENRDDRRVHRVELADDEVVQRNGVPVTSAARTWRDLAGVLDPAALLAVTDQLLAGHCRREDLEEQLRRRPRGRGCARARQVLQVADARAESPMESVLRWVLYVAGIPAPVLQYEVRDAGGRLLGRADLAWPDRRVLVEFDGDVHRERDVFVKDLRRQNALVADGWTVLRFTSADVLGRPDEVVTEVRRALSR